MLARSSPAWLSVDTRISSIACFTSMLQTAKLPCEFKGLLLVAGFQCLSHQVKHGSPTHTNLERCVYQAFCFCHTVHFLHLFPQTCSVPQHLFSECHSDR